MFGVPTRRLPDPQLEPAADSFDPPGSNHSSGPAHAQAARSTSSPHAGNRGDISSESYRRATARNAFASVHLIDEAPRSLVPSHPPGHAPLPQVSMPPHEREVRTKRARRTHRFVAAVLPVARSGHAAVAVGDGAVLARGRSHTPAAATKAPTARPHAVCAHVGGGDHPHGSERSTTARRPATMSSNRCPVYLSSNSRVPGYLQKSYAGSCWPWPCLPKRP